MATITLYHGSDTHFDKIDTKMQNNKAKCFCLATTKESAMAYGNIIYTIEVSYLVKEFQTKRCNNGTTADELKEVLPEVIEKMVKKGKKLLQLNNYTDQIINKEYNTPNATYTHYFIPTECDAPKMQIISKEIITN